MRSGELTVKIVKIKMEYINVNIRDILRKNGVRDTDVSGVDINVSAR